jgi:hypothetical protein
MGFEDEVERSAVEQLLVRKSSQRIFLSVLRRDTTAPDYSALLLTETAVQGLPAAPRFG